MLIWLFVAAAVTTAAIGVLALRRGAPLVALVCAALTYDNVVIAAGTSIGAGPLLEGLNAGRFWAHALITPLMILAVLRLGVRVPAREVFWALTVLLVAYGAYIEIVRLRLGPRQESGTLRYVNVAAEGPPIAAIVTILVLIGLGIFIWRKSGRPWVAVGALTMFVAAAAGASVVWVQNLGEIALAACLVAGLAPKMPCESSEGSVSLSS